MNIYVTAPVGTSGALELYNEHPEEMSKRFSSFFQTQIGKISCQPEGEQEITLAKNKDCIYICTMNEGGLFRALWDGCEKLNCGCEVFLESIPIRQETIEITEVTGDNPYEIASSGNFLLFSNTDAFDAEPSWYLIGRTTAAKDRVVIANGNRRFLTPPQRQQKDINSRKSGRP